MNSTQCGVVVEQDAIVSEVTFGEASTGAAVVQGSLVSNDQSKLEGNHPAMRCFTVLMQSPFFVQSVLNFGLIFY